MGWRSNRIYTLADGERGAINMGRIRYGGKRVTASWDDSVAAVM